MSSEPYVVMIDDDRFWTIQYRGSLRKCQLEVRCAQTFDDGLALSLDDRSRVIILDVMMPPGSGQASEDTEDGLATGLMLLRNATIRSRVEAGTTRVLVLTNRDVPTVRAKVYEQLGYTDKQVRIAHKGETSPDLVAALVDGWMAL